MNRNYFFPSQQEQDSKSLYLYQLWQAQGHKAWKMILELKAQKTSTIILKNLHHNQGWKIPVLNEGDQHV